MSEPAPGAAGERARFALIAVAGAGLGGHDEPLTYAVPDALRERITAGSIVWAPLREQIVAGVAIALGDEEPEEFEVRPLAGCIDDFALSEKQLSVAAWIARQTATSLGVAASLFFPPQLANRAVELLSVVSVRPDDALLTRQQVETLDVLERLGEATPEQLRSRMNRPLTSLLPALIKAGHIERRMVLPPYTPKREEARQIRLAGDMPAAPRGERQRALIEYLDIRRRAGAGDGWVDERIALRASNAPASTIARLIAIGAIERRAVDRAVLAASSDLAPALTSEQQDAWRAIEALLASNSPDPLLLRGVTGSGKTELYLRAAAWSLRRGRAVIILAPEIALASQLVRRVSARFPADTVILHSSLTPRDRLDAWHAIEQGDRRVIVGPRSALFAPLDTIGLIILDEEHEPAYKQELAPRYHARTVAERLAREHGGLLMLGSATPSIESIARVSAGTMREARLSSRVNPVVGGGSGETLALPKVEIVDLRLELHQGHTSLLSRPLIEAITNALAAGEQTLLFQNRRGSATVVLCSDCGQAIRCPYCDIPHTFHEDRRRLVCHRCGYQALPPVRCPECGGHLQYLGAGTQRVARVAELTFPAARIARWDQDAVRRRGAQEQLLRRIEERELDIIVGTQMIAKGLDLPHVTTVGVIQADGLMQLPDFRAAERAFQLVTQVAGRAGRRRSGGRVIVQTYSPAHYAIQAAAGHDVDAFLREEIEFRRRQRYPPFSRLIRYTIRRSTDEQCAEASDALARSLARHARALAVEIELLGPAPAFAYRIGGLYQWQLIVRAAPDDLERLLDGLPAPPGWAVDVDPVSVV